MPLRLPKFDLDPRWRLMQLRQSFTCLRHDVLHEGREYAHLAYFGAVFFEGHGLYSGMGGILLILGTLAVIFHEGEP